MNPNCDETLICSQCEVTTDNLRSLVYKNVKTDEEDSYLSDLCYSCFEQAVDLISQSDEIAPFCIECHAELKIPEEAGKGVECQC